MKLYTPNAQGAYALQRTEEYAYDAQRDYLTGVDYNDGLANEVQTWGYDAAGNRVADSVQGNYWQYDNLNRMIESPVGGYENDILGNRLNRNWGGPTPNSTTRKYGWDAINRMTRVIGPSAGAVPILTHIKSPPDDPPQLS